MRRVADPTIQELFFAMLRQGMSQVEAAETVGLTPREVSLELTRDHMFRESVRLAKEAAFNRVYQKAVELSMSADEEGELKGSHSAMELVFKHFNADQDRYHRSALVQEKAHADVEVQHALAPPLSNPDAIEAFLAATGGLIEAPTQGEQNDDEGDQPTRPPGQGDNVHDVADRDASDGPDPID